MTPDALPEPLAVAMQVARCCDECGVRYVIGGSFASSLHGEPRSTNDVDIVADLDAASAEAFIECLGSSFYADSAAAVEATRLARGAFNVIHIETAVKIDVFVAGDDALDLERLRRRVGVAFSAATPHTRLFVDTAENIVLRKLEWYRRGGEVSDRQWRDVLAVLGVQGQLDHEYMQEWAARLGVADLLSRAIREVAG